MLSITKSNKQCTGHPTASQARYLRKLKIIHLIDETEQVSCAESYTVWILVRFAEFKQSTLQQTSILKETKKNPKSLRAKTRVTEHAVLD